MGGFLQADYRMGQDENGPHILTSQGLTTYRRNDTRTVSLRLRRRGGRRCGELVEPTEPKI